MSSLPQVADLNKMPKLPYGDSEFDFVTNVVPWSRAGCAEVGVSRS